MALCGVFWLAYSHFGVLHGWSASPTENINCKATKHCGSIDDRHEDFEKSARGLVKIRDLRMYG
jgi:hypothetical protein